jgi:hypothetical protein
MRALIVAVTITLKTPSGGDALGTTRNVDRVGILIRVTVRSLPDGRQSGSDPETGFEESMDDLPEADFWPGISSGLPVTRPEIPAALRSRLAKGPPSAATRYVLSGCTWPVLFPARS